MKKYLIIGGGQAGFSAASKLRVLDKESQIDILCGENFLPYQRPPLSKAFLLGKTNIERLEFRAKNFFTENKINIHLGELAKEIATEKNQVITTKQKFNYDKLLIATGARARQLNMNGEHVLRNINDAKKLKQKLEQSKTLAIIGAGYIGLEVAAIARQLNIAVDIFELENRILKRVACKETSNHFQKLHETNGVKFHLSTSKPNIKADLILAGIGAIANVELAEQAGIKTNNGILINENCQTNDCHIFAAGDCAKKNQRIESVANAIHQGEVAAHAMSGVVYNKNFTAWFWSDQYNTKLQIAGLNAGYEKVIAREGGGKKSIWYFKGKKLIAIDAINDAPSYMHAKRMLENNQSPNQADIANPALEINQWKLQKNT